MSEAVFSLWVGKRLSLLERLCAKSHLANGHAFELYTYGDTGGIPDGVRVLPAQDILPPDQIDRYMLRYKPHVHGAELGRSGEFKGFVTPFSDLFRLKALAERGGTWVDLDIVCLAPFPQRHLLASERQRDGARKIANSVMRIPAGFAAEMFGRALRFDPASLRHEDIGSRMISPAVAEFGLEADVAPPDCFCPVDWWDWRRLIRDDFALPAGTIGVHLWNSQWLLGNADKDRLYPDTTLYGGLQRRYL